MSSSSHTSRSALEPVLATYFRHRSSCLLMLAWPVVAWALLGRHVGPAASAIGFSVVASGVLLRLLAVRRIGRGARVHRAHASAGLICTGPYRWTRNPLYVAAGLMLVGLAALAGAGAFGAALMFFATIVIYTPVVAHEEKALSPLIGPAYQDYAGATPRWLGIPRAWQAPTDVDLTPWREVFRREKGLVPGSLAAVVGVVLLRSDFLSIASLFESTVRGLGLEPALGVGLGFLAGAAGNSWNVDRKRRRRARSSPTGVSENPSAS